MTVDREQHEKILGKVRALLAQAEHKNTSPEEAEVFMAKAQALIAKYGFEEDELAIQDPERGFQVGDRKFECHAPFAQEKVHLWGSIATPMGIKSVQRKEWKSGKPYRESRADKQVIILHVFGTKADLDRAELLYTSLLLQQASALRKAEVPEWVTWHGRTAWNRSWLIGFGDRIFYRIQEAENAARAETMTDASGQSVSTALVLASKDELVLAAQAEAYPSLKKVSNRKLSGRGYYDGDMAGRKANLGLDDQIEQTAKGALR